MFEFKLLINTVDFCHYPKINSGLRIGPVVGDCVNYYLDDKGQCTHVVMQVAGINNNGKCSEEDRELCSHFGMVECPHVPNKFCNMQFGDGSHCACCDARIKMEGENIHFVLEMLIGDYLYCYLEDDDTSNEDKVRMVQGIHDLCHKLGIDPKPYDVDKLL